MRERNAAKASLLYDLIDASDLFRGTAQRDSCAPSQTSRSARTALSSMPHSSHTPRGAGPSDIKGHRVAGGMRASIYNAVSMESVEALAACMRDFERTAPRSICWGAPSPRHLLFDYVEGRALGWGW